MREGTFEAWIHAEMLKNGLWPRDAAAVLAKIKADEKDALNEVMDKQSKGYPIEMFAVAWLSIQRVALAWLEENKPNHWAKPMFMPRAERDALLADYLPKEDRPDA